MKDMKSIAVLKLVPEEKYFAERFTVEPRTVVAFDLTRS